MKSSSVLAAFFLAACDSTTAPCCTAQQGFSHHAVLSGTVRSVSGNALDSARVVVNPGSRGGYAYGVYTFLTGTDGRYAVTVQRFRMGFDVDSLPDSDTITVHVGAAAMKRTDISIGGEMISKDTTVVLTFTSSSEAPASNSLDFRLGTPRR